VAEPVPPNDVSYDPFRWLKWGALVLAAITLLSTFVYWLLGQYYRPVPEWTLFDCLFMVVITLTTIGYGDWLGIRGKELAEVYTMLLAVVGMGVPAFVITNAIGLIVEGLLSNAFRRRRMDKQIAEIRDHLIVCGIGTTGYHCVEELLKTRRPFVAIDRDEQKLVAARGSLGEFPYLVGAAEDDNVLRGAGIERAAGLIACLADDKDNLFVTLSGRALNPALRIVSKVVDELARPKLITAGATAVVNTTAVGGLRMVSELVRPSVVTFLDSMLRDPGEPYRFEELTVVAGSPVVGRSLAAADLRKLAEVLVVATRAPGAQRFIYNPHADFPLEAGCTIVFLGRSEDLAALRPHFAGSARA
jgi:voltage-gated potassium channel